ncbi:MAG TPA: amidase, partial [Casimicrobiaceae bacterium]|nr:amidase [Casimicrobiaceae bacterium]
MALHDLGLVEAAAGIRMRRFSSEALTASCLDRIALHDARVLAWAWLDPEHALAQARECDAVLRRGDIAGPLHGVPVGVKDIIYTKGIPTGMGSPIFADFVPAYSAACIERLEAAGGFVLGKTVTAEFATQHPGKTRNPWNPEHTPGGSSSGSAAAVAARFVPGALGTQTKGSTIRPAAYCGVVGFKPTLGVVSRHGVHAVSETLDQIGLFARSVDDVALLAAIIAGRDSRDATTCGDAQALLPASALAGRASPPRLAAVRTPFWSVAEDEQQALFVANCNALRESGAHVQDVELPAIFDEAADVINILQMSELAHNFADMMAHSADRVSAAFRRFYDAGVAYTAVEYLRAQRKRQGMRAALDSLLADHDAIVTPPA